MKPMLFLGAAVAGALVIAAGTIYQAAAADPATASSPPALQADAGPDNGAADAGPGAPPGPGGMPSWGPGPAMMHHGDWMPGGPDGEGRRHHDMFGLFAEAKNKDLTAADVKVIAQAILLEHGQHGWTVTNVTSEAGLIDFSYATAHGDVVASFSVDPKTGHMKRIG